MGTILNREQCKQIDFLRRKLRPYYNRGWMCEGTDDANGNLYNIIFNNNTDEWFKSDYDGNIIESKLTVTPLTDAKVMAVLEGKIRRI